MQVIRWELNPAVAGNQYARGLHDYLVFIDRRSESYLSHAASINSSITFTPTPTPSTRPAWIEATRTDIVIFIEDLTYRPNPRGDSIRYLRSEPRAPLGFRQSWRQSVRGR